MTWNKKDSVDVRGLDDQDQGLINFLNRFHAASMTGKACEVANAAIPGFVKLATEHSTAEEKLMESIRFPGLAAHRIKYREMSERLAEIASSYREGDNAVYVRILYFTRNILARHIHDEDQQYA
jgi:hemerythrin-like metal-binding protein